MSEHVENMKNTEDNIKEETDQKPGKWKNRKRILPSVLISISIPLILCIAIPFEIYSTNMQEFLFDIWDFLPICFAFGVALAAVILLVLLFVPERLYKIFSLIVLAFALLLFIQGNYLNAGMNSLEGDRLISGGASTGTKIINLFVWFVLIGGAVGVSFIKDKRGIVGIVSIVLAIIVIIAHLVIPVFAIISIDNVFMSKEDKLAGGSSTNLAQFTSTKNLTTLSSTSNIFYFVIDRFDEYYAEEVDKSDPELFKSLEGFTQFKDNISLYGRTFPSVPYMLTNYRYDVSLYKEENHNKAYEVNTTLKTLHENEYKINIFGERKSDYNEANNLPDYVENVSDVYKYKVDNPVLLSLYMICYAVYRCSPLIIKPIYSGVNSVSCNLLVSMRDAEGYVNYSPDNEEALKLVKGSPFKVTDEKIFSFIHFDGCHSVNIDYKNGTAHPSSKQVKKIIKSTKECFEIINLYIAELKKIGAYKNATIIITGDHGAAGSDTTKVTSSKLTALFVKPSGSDEGFKLSDAQVTHNNIWPMIMQSENIRTDEDFGTSLFDIDEHENRVREFILQAYTRDTLDEYYYEIKGKGSNFDNWEYVKTLHADKYLMG